MLWQLILQKKCKELTKDRGVTIEPILDKEGRLILVCPRMPAKDIQEEVLAVVPAQQDYAFVERPKSTTTTTIGMYMIPLTAIGCCPDIGISEKKRSISIKVQSPNIDYEAVWKQLFSKVVDLIERDGFFDSWSITVNDKTESKNIAISAKIYADQKNNSRDRSIGSDDLLDLKIMLGSSQDVNDFINQL